MSPQIIGSTSAPGRRTLIMLPPGRACIARPRSAIIFNPSSSLKTPAVQAAANSPIEWPINAVGVIPHDIQTWANE